MLERWLSPALFQALGDPSRVAILVALSGAGRERTVSQVAACCPVDMSVVSRHLRILRDAGVVEARRQGKEVLYRVRFDPVVAALRNLANALEACCPPPARDAAATGAHPRTRQGGAR